MSRARCAASIAAVVFAIWFGSFAATAAERSGADLLPSSTAFYAEIADPGKLIDLVLDHPIHQRLREADNYRQALDSPQYQQLLLAVKAFEGAVDIRWRPAAKLLTEGGVYFAADPTSQGAVLLVKSGDGEKLAALKDAILTVARADAQQKGGDNPIRSGEYRGIVAHALGEARLAVAGEWLVVTNKSELGKEILDRYLAGENGAANSSLSSSERFQQAEAGRPTDAAAWAYVDLATLREAGRAQKLLEGPGNNPLAEILLGGLLETAGHSPYVMLALQADQERLALTAAMPFDPSRLGELRAYYFGPDGEGFAPPPLKIEHAVFQLAAYRDLAEFWAAAPDLFDENITAKFAEADSSLTTLLSGRDFGDEVLGSLEPGIRLVVARQELPQGDLPAPDVKLPAFAAVVRLNEEANVRRNLKVSFQSLMGFLNVVGAMNGQPPLEQSTERNGDVEIVSGAYLPPVDEEDSPRGLINYNFSPTAVFAGDLLILSSTRALAEEIAAAANDDEASPRSEQVNLQARLDPGVLRSILNDNREQLIAQNMLEKGHSRDEAENEIGDLLSLLSWLGDAGLRLAREEGVLRAELSVDLASPSDEE